jgi:hypothetical protein
MSHFVPAGCLTPAAALDRVVELMQGDDAGPLLTEKRRPCCETSEPESMRRHTPNRSR